MLSLQKQKGNHKTKNTQIKQINNKKNYVYVFVILFVCYYLIFHNTLGLMLSSWVFNAAFKAALYEILNDMI